MYLYIFINPLYKDIILDPGIETVIISNATKMF